MVNSLPFLVVAAQPTLDHTVVIPGLSVGKAHRVGQVIILPSGKALNVSRSLHTLGAEVRVAALLAGHNGRWILESLSDTGISVHPVWMEGENRVAYSVYDKSQGTLTEFIEDTDGPVSAQDWKLFQQVVGDLLLDACALILTGRAPKGTPEQGYKQLVELAQEFHKPVYIDCYGPLLTHVILKHLTLLKLNQREAGILLGTDLNSPKDCIMAARRLGNSTIDYIIVTMGANGAVAVSNGKAWQAWPPKLQGAAIGSGDAMMAGVVMALQQNQPFEDAFRLGMAVGAANVLIPGAGVFSPDAVEHIINEIEIIQVS